MPKYRLNWIISVFFLKILESYINSQSLYSFVFNIYNLIILFEINSDCLLLFFSLLQCCNSEGLLIGPLPKALPLVKSQSDEEPSTLGEAGVMEKLFLFKKIIIYL